jgi:endonuclease/exonuclease/phosphatase family metal-dependent hydrolase
VDPKQRQPLLFLAVLIAAGAFFFLRSRQEPAPEAPGEGYLFCFWNVENLFDDSDDDYPDTKRSPDEEYDNLFARQPALLEEKLSKLSKVLLTMNGGQGPDILALAEVESERAADLLRQRLNKDLGNKAAPYDNLLFRENKVGRHIATAILTRLPVNRSKTDKLDKPRRILEGHIVVNGNQLVVIASHWTSQLSDKTGKGRAKYADIIYGRFRQIWTANHDIDLLVCGDFNDTPDSAPVTEHLHATGDRSALLGPEGEPRLFNLAAGKDPEKYGSHMFRRGWYIYDQIAVSPGLLNEKGWTCLPDTFRTVRLPTMQNRYGGPWSFDRDHSGNKVEKSGGERGVSDHFPVTVRLKVSGG